MITLSGFGEDYELWRSLLCNFSATLFFK